MARISLDNLRVASPCTASWDEMTGNEQVRFCGLCALHVYNLSAMSPAEAETLIEQREGRTCIRLYRRADGTVITRDCPRGPHSTWDRLRLLAGLLATGLLVVVGSSYLWFVSSRQSADANRRWRDIEPLHTIMEWLDPTPPFRSTMEMGKLCDFPPSGPDGPPGPPEKLPPPEE